MFDHTAQFDREVLQAIVGAGPRGATIPDILDSVDYSEKLLLRLADLNDSLERLIAADLIVPRSGGRYASRGRADDSHPGFEPVTADAYQAAVDAYRTAFTNSLRELDSGHRGPNSPTWPKLSGQWRLADGHYATDLELEGIGAVLDRIVSALSADGFAAAAGGLSVGPGSVGFAIFGTRDDDADLMLRVARPTFASVAPGGSALVVDEWDPADVGPSFADVADELERNSGS